MRILEFILRVLMILLVAPLLVVAAGVMVCGVVSVTVWDSSLLDQFCKLVIPWISSLIKFTVYYFITFLAWFPVHRKYDGDRIKFSSIIRRKKD
jgi:hypothetical protein